MEKKNNKKLIIAILIVVILIIASIIGIFISKKLNNGTNENSQNKSMFSFLDSIKKETVTADTFEDISNRIGAELNNEDELYYFSYSVMYYMTKDGLAAAFSNPDDDNAMYVSIYGKTVGQLIDEGKELMKQNNMTIEKFKETLKDVNEQSKEDTTKVEDKNTLSEMKLNEACRVTRSDGGEYSVTFEGIRETSERNQFSDINPKKVIFVDYKYENHSNLDDVYVGSTHFKVMDDEGNVLDTYPVSDDTRNAKSIPIGGKSSATEAYALMTDSKNITILYYDYNSRPLGKLVVSL